MNDKLINIIVGGNRFVEIKDEDNQVYKFDRFFFSLYVLLVLIVFMIIFVSYGSDKSDHIYFRCSTINNCENVFYNNYPICEKVWDGACNQEFVNSGFVYGEPIPFMVKNWSIIVFGLLIITFIINHFIHNKNFRFNKVRDL